MEKPILGETESLRSTANLYESVLFDDPEKTREQILEEMTPQEQEEYKIDEERCMHWARFNRQALEHGEKGMFGKIFEAATSENVEKKISKRIRAWNKELSAIDYAHMEGLRDDADFEKRNIQEILEGEKDLRIVADAIINKKEHPDSPEAQDTRIMIVVMGGGMAGIIGMGQLTAMHELGYDEGVFDVGIGTSAGACALSYFIANGERVARGAHAFYTKMCTKAFINFMRLHRIMNVDYVTETMLDIKGDDYLNKEGLMKSKTEFYVGAVNQETGESELVNGKTAKEGPEQAIKGSMAVPWLYANAVEITQPGEEKPKKLIDGALNALPFVEAVEKFKPTHILIITNQMRDTAESFKLSDGELLFSETAEKLGSIGSIGTARKLVTMKQAMEQVLKDKNNQTKVKVGMMWSPVSLSPLERNPKEVKHAAEQAMLQTFELFGKGDKYKYTKDLEGMLPD